MKRSKPAENVIIEYTDWSKYFPWLTQFAFFFAIALVAARAMTLEVLRGSMGASAGPRGCGPACSAMLDLLCCLPALLVLLRRAVDKTYIIRLTWAEALILAFAIWAMLSPLWAYDRFAAAVQAGHLLAAVALFWAMAQLVRSWTRLRLVAATCFGLLLVYLAHGLMFRFVDVPENIRYWREHRSEEMRTHGWQEGDYALHNFEQRIIQGEIQGFQQSTNSFAAVIVLLGVISAGVVMQRFANKDEPALAVAILLPFPVALWIIFLTESKAAYATPVLAAIILVANAYLRHWLSNNHRRAFWIVVAAIAMAAFAVVAHGLYHGSLPSLSLAYRWRYWSAAMHIFAQHPLLGIGYSNFGYWYLGARIPQAAEEVKDPHNLLVHIMVELGLVGAVLLIAWLGRAWWEWTSPILPAPAPAKTPGKSSRWEMVFTIGSLSIGAILINILINIDFGFIFNSDGGGAWFAFELLKRLVFFGLLVIGCATVLAGSTISAAMDSRPSPWMLYGMLAALGVFLVHNLIDFSWFEAGPMCLFTLVGGAVLGVRSPSAAGQRKKTGIAISAFAAALVIWAVGAIFYIVPLADAEGRAAAGDDAVRRQNYRLAAEQYQAAFLASPVKNADYAIKAGQAWTLLTDADAQARAMLGTAIDINPIDPLGYLIRARYNLRQHADKRDEIRRDFEKALSLNPYDLATHLEYARILEEFGDRTGAIAQYQFVLQTNDQFDPDEPQRLPAQRVEEIRKRITSQ